MAKYNEEDPWEIDLGCLECGVRVFKESKIPGVCMDCASIDWSRSYNDPEEYFYEEENIIIIS